MNTISKERPVSKEDISVEVRKVPEGYALTTIWNGTSSKVKGSVTHESASQRKQTEIIPTNNLATLTRVYAGRQERADIGLGISATIAALGIGTFIHETYKFITNQPVQPEASVAGFAAGGIGVPITYAFYRSHALVKRQLNAIEQYSPKS